MHENKRQFLRCYSDACVQVFDFLHVIASVASLRPSTVIEWWEEADKSHFFLALGFLSNRHLKLLTRVVGVEK